MKKYTKGIAIYVLVFLCILIVIIAANLSNPTQPTETYTYSDLFKQIENNEIKKIEIVLDSEIRNVGKAIAHKEGSSSFTVDIPAIDVFMNNISDLQQKADLDLQIVTVPPTKTSWLVQFIPPIIIMVISVCLLIFILQQMQGGGSSGRGVMSFGKSKAKLAVDDKNKITFSQVAGLEEEKAELEEVVEFLKHPKKFIEIGARIPKGILLVGPPGTGKTYLAKACSGEAGVPFFSISGSDFVEMFVGVGASRVRDLFEQAKKNSPCLVFIDEIDAVGRRRGAGLGGGHDEREQTLNQLLVEMDGFGANEGVIILAATNRADILDPALLRPGRFDRRVAVGKPDSKGREEVLKVHAKGKVIDPEVDFKIVAQTTSGFTPADLENLLNEAALLSARNNKKSIDMEEIKKAFIKIGIGTEKKSHIVSEKERKLTAYHEAGHAIIHELMSEIDSTYMVSIIPTGWAGGYTMPLPGPDKMSLSRTYMKQHIVSLLGGRAAEELVLGDITTGASNDIERATTTARSMVTKYGMSDVLGPIQFGEENEEIFIGRELGHSRNYGEEIATTIDQEVKKIVTEAYQNALDLLNEHMETLHKVSELLLEKEKISGDELRDLFPKGVLTKKIEVSFMEKFDSKVKDDDSNKEPLDEIKSDSKDKTETKDDGIPKADWGENITKQNEDDK